MTTMTARLSRFPFARSVPPAEPVFDESELAREACGGNRAAFGELYTRYARMIHGVLLTRVPFSEAEDLTHDVFMAAFRKLPSLREPAAFAGWLASIARNRAAEFHLTARHESAANVEAARGRASQSQPAALDILEIVRALPEAYRETLILRLVEGMTGPEIAERTGLTPDSVRVNLFRGMKMLRERLGGGTAK